MSDHDDPPVDLEQATEPTGIEFVSSRTTTTVERHASRPGDDEITVKHRAWFDVLPEAGVPDLTHKYGSQVFGVERVWADWENGGLVKVTADGHLRKVDGTLSTKANPLSTDWEPNWHTKRFDRDALPATIRDRIESYESAVAGAGVVA